VIKMHFATRNRERNCSKFVFIMTRLPAVLNVINIIFHLQGKDYTRAWLAKLSTHRRRIKRTCLLHVYSWSVSCPIFKTKHLFCNGILWFPKHRLLCVNKCYPAVCKQCYPDCESTGLKPVMDCNIPCIYIAQTQRWRMITSKYNTKVIL
jgi:hypothetical protein